MTVVTARSSAPPSGPRWSASTATGCWRTTRCRPGPSRRSRPTASWSSATCTSTTPPRSRSASGWAGSRSSARGENPEIFRVTLDPAKNPCRRLPARDVRLAHRRLHRRRADHGDHPQRPCRGRVGRGDRVRQHLRGVRRPRRGGEGALPVLCGSSTPSRPPSAWSTTTPHPRSSPCGGNDRPRSTRWSGRTSRVGGRWCSARPPRTWSGMDVDEGRALLADLLAPVDDARPRVPPRVGGRRPGDLGQPGRAAPGVPLRPDVSPGHAPHDPARRGAHSVTTERTAIVTGGASGIGLAIAERLAADGNAVAIFDRDGAAAATAAAEDRGAGRHRHRRRGRRDGPRARSMPASPRCASGSAGPPSWSTAPAWTDSTRSSRSPPRSGTASWPSTSPGPFDCCQAVVPDMIEEGWGRIVNISSSSAHGGQPLMTHYVASKAGVIGFTKALALELGPKGITVNTIPPGFIDTPMLRASESKGLLGEGVEHHAALTPVRRVGPTRGHRRGVRLPRQGRGELHHRPGDRGQRRAEHLRWRASRPSRPGNGPTQMRDALAAAASGRRPPSPPRDEGPAQGAERPRHTGPAPRTDEGLQHLQRVHPLLVDADAASARAARPPGRLGPPVGLRVGAAPPAGRRTPASGPTRWSRIARAPTPPAGPPWTEPCSRRWTTWSAAAWRSRT